MGVTGGPRVYEFGAYRLDTDRQALCYLPDDRWSPLTPRVFDTLLYLVEHAGTLVDKSSLMAAVWPHVIVEENNLDQNISTLRQLLGERRGDHRYIVTVRGRGYRFVAPVVAVNGQQAVIGDGAATQPPEKAGERADRVPVLPHVTTGLRRRGGLLAAAGIAAVAVAAFFLAGRGEQSSGIAITGPPTLAVLPFRPLSADDRNESLELGMAETLIMQLNGIDLKVRPLSAVRRFADLEQDAVLAGRALGADTVLEGYLQREGNRLRVTARLLDVTDGQQLWADRYDESFTDIFFVQDSIAAKVRDALTQAPLSARSPALRRYTEDAEAYQLYLGGRFYRQRGNEAGLRSALAHFRQAIERDPGFALAYVGLADSYSVLGVFGIIAPHDVFPQAQQAAGKALELAPDLGEAYASLGHIKVQYEHDWSGGEQALRRAIELNPNYAPAHQWLGLYLASSGRFDEGLAALHDAQALEPSAPIYSALIGMVLTYQRRYDEAVVRLETTLEMDPALAAAHTYLAAACMHRGEFDRALEHLGRASSLTPGSAAYRGRIYALSGRNGEALAEIERLLELSRERYVAAYDIATIYAQLGDVDETFAWLERAFEDRSQLIAWVPWDPAFDSVREDARYARVVRRLNVVGS